MSKLPAPIAFEWSEGNFEKNWLKHGVSNKEAEEVFSNKQLVLYKDKKHSQIEERLIALGMTVKNRKLCIAFTIRGDKLRIISARDQSKKERRLYEQEI